MQALNPDSSANFPAAQTSHLTVPSASAYVPAAQSVHVAFDVAAVRVENLPCEHSEHGADPFTSLNVPGIHSEHAWPSTQIDTLAYKVYPSHSTQDSSWHSQDAAVSILTGTSPVAATTTVLFPPAHAQQADIALTPNAF